VFYRERRDILTLKTKKEYFGHFIQAILPEWNRLLAEKVALDETGEQGYSPDNEFTPEDWLMKQAHDQLRIVWLEVKTFLSQEGVREAIFAPALSANLKHLENFLSELPKIDDSNDAAVRLFFQKSYKAIEMLDISSFIM
jgi:hypothetical protein